MVYVTSDLHGYMPDKFFALLDKAGFTDDDFLVILGDVIDRGEHGAELLRWIIERDNVELILGNHELMMLNCEFAFAEITEESVGELSAEKMRAFNNWCRNGAEQTIKGLRSLSRETVLDILDYLKSCSLYEDVVIGGKRFVLTHGGIDNFEEGKPLDEYDPHDLVWYRPSLCETFGKDFTLIVGHTPTAHYGDEYKGRAIHGNGWINIDTGVAFGLHPMLLRLDDMKEFYVD